MILFNKIFKLWLKITWNFSWIILKPIVRSKIISSSYLHLENVSLPVIFAGNHVSIYDPWVMGIVLPFNSKFFPIRFLAKASFFTYKFFYFGYLLKFIFGAIPVRKGIGLENSLKKAVNCLKAGYCLGIFPGGKISLDFDKKYRGIGYLHKVSKMPIVPVFIDKSFSFLNLFKKDFKVKVYFGEPISCFEKEIEEIVDIVIERISELKQQNGLK